MTESISRQSEAEEPLAGPLRHEDGRPIVAPRFVGALVSIGEAVFMTSAGAPPPERLGWLAGELEDFLARAGFRTRWLLRLAVLAVSVLAPLAAGRMPPIHRLALRERARALTLLERSRMGAPVLAVKALLCVLYYEHPDAAREIGFDGACLTRLAPANGAKATRR
jgi:hypothetical protein